MSLTTQKLDLISLLGRQLSHLIKDGRSLDEAFGKLREVTDESISSHIENLEQLMNAEKPRPINTLYRDSPIPAIFELSRKAEEYGGNPLAILSGLANTLDSLTGGYRSYWLGIGSFLYYAVALLVVALVALSIFSIFVFPQFNEMFISFGAKLPPLTEFWVNALDFLHGPILLAGAGMIIWLAVLTLEIRNSMRRLSAVNGMAKKMPGLRRICRTYNESLTVNFACLLLDAGVVAEVALTQAEKLTKTSLRIETDREAGSDLARRIGQKSIRGCLLLADRCGVLAEELRHLSTETEVLHAEVLIRVRGEFILFAQVSTAILIGLLVMGMYLPIFKMGSIV
ncbi:MAG: hypothetical protein OEY09_07595 [Gammaproteobacteria bacterium]|nr:hypothetical protein [Gammaproteobacteria bacterium]